MTDSCYLPIEEQEQHFKFYMLENVDSIICRIISNGKELYLDQDLTPFDGSFPAHWIEPAIEALKEMLEP